MGNDEQAAVEPAVGKVYPPLTYVAGREKLIEYARAIGETDPICLDHAAARAAGYADVVATPMFVAVYQGVAAQAPLFDPELGIDFDHLVHGAQEYRWGPVVVAGDELTSTVTVASISERVGMRFYVFETDSVNQRGETAAHGTMTVIVREAT